MKVLLCGECSAMVSGPSNGSWRWCDCGNAAIRWIDAVRGIVEVWADVRELVRVIGFNNHMLELAYRPGGSLGDEMWRTLHAHTAHVIPERYLFHEDKRACWAVIFRPGETSDSRYADERPQR